MPRNPCRPEMMRKTVGGPRHGDVEMVARMAIFAKNAEPNREEGGLRKNLMKRKIYATSPKLNAGKKQTRMVGQPYQFVVDYIGTLYSMDCLPYLL